MLSYLVIDCIVVSIEHSKLGKYNTAYILTNQGKIRALYNPKIYQIALLSKSLAKLTEHSNLIYAEFYNIEHVCTPNTHAQHALSFLTHLAIIYICQLIRYYVPLNQPCSNIMQACLIALSALKGQNWKSAWLKFEEHFTHTSDITLSLQNLYEQYGSVPHLSIRNCLLAKTFDS